MKKRKSRVYIFSVGTSLTVLLALALSFTNEELDKQKRDQVYYTLLEQPSKYEKIPFVDFFNASAGTYAFDFVPSGNSPKTLLVSVTGPSLAFQEDFTLNGTLHDRAISKYHTWEYTYTNSGKFSLDSSQTLQIKIKTKLLQKEASSTKQSSPVSIYVLKERT